MIIDLDSIGRSPKELDVTFERSQIDLDEQSRVNGEIRFKGSISREGLKATVRGNITTDVSVDCSRCLEPLERHLDIPFEAVFVDALEEPRDIEVQVGSEALDESLIRDGKIDLEDVVREQIILALPASILCREDCKSLCPKCGANKNLINCKCIDDEIDPRWAALMNLN